MTIIRHLTEGISLYSEDDLHINSLAATMVALSAFEANSDAIERLIARITGHPAKINAWGWQVPEASLNGAAHAPITWLCEACICHGIEMEATRWGADGQHLCQCCASWRDTDAAR